VELTWGSSFFFSFIVSDRPGLRNPDLVERMWRKLTELLKQVIRKRQRTHKADGLGQGESDPISEEQAEQMYDELVKKIPDLRTLNTLHSEKLLAFKMTEQVKQEKELDAEVKADVYRCPNGVAPAHRNVAKWEHDDHHAGIGSSSSSTSSGHGSGSSGCASPRSPHSLMSEEGVKSPGMKP
jgi:nuclear receptor subfamily 1 group D protein 3